MSHLNKSKNPLKPSEKAYFLYMGTFDGKLTLIIENKRI